MIKKNKGSPCHYPNGKLLLVWEVTTHSESFCLPILVIIIETSWMGMLMRQFWTSWSVREEPNESAFMTSRLGSLHFSPLKCGFHVVKNKTMWWENFKLWYIYLSKKKLKFQNLYLSPKPDSYDSNFQFLPVQNSIQFNSILVVARPERSIQIYIHFSARESFIQI